MQSILERAIKPRGKVLNYWRRKQLQATLNAIALASGSLIAIPLNGIQCADLVTLVFL